MVIKPRTRGFICTTSHPTGCEENVKACAGVMDGAKGEGPKSVLVLGGSTGYGLASRAAAAFGYGAATLGVAFEREASGTRTATAGWYNTLAFDRLAREKGLLSKSINGDAFSDELKQAVVDEIRSTMPDGKVDMVVYSLAAPKRTDPRAGVTWSSVIKPIGASFDSKTVDFHTGVVSDVSVKPAEAEEIEGTVKVMGGEDWLWWIEALRDAGVLSEGVVTLAYSYIGPELTHPVYKDGTIGRAKQDLYDKAHEISALLQGMGGKAFVSVNKALVTQASSAIPVVPLYISLLYRVMSEKGLHEECPEQMKRLFERLYTRSGGWGTVPVDGDGLIRMDDWEMREDIQREVMERWERVNTENLAELSDIGGYRTAFLRLFGFEVTGVDYERDVQP